MREEFEEDMRSVASDARDIRLTDADFESELGSLVAKLKNVRAIAKANREPEKEPE
jgi:hypothetical protein